MRALAFLFVLGFAAATSGQDKSVVLYTSLAPTESGPLAQAFEKKTGIKGEVWRAISEKVVQRAITEARARRFSVDVIETNGPELEMMSREKLFR
jgi:iron(III) transport system substrate-binding protein